MRAAARWSVSTVTSPLKGCFWAKLYSTPPRRAYDGGKGSFAQKDINCDTHLFVLRGGKYEPTARDRATAIKDNDSIRVERGNLTCRYNSDLQLISITDKSGETYTFKYSGGKLEQVVTSTGKTTYTYDSEGNLKSITGPDGKVIQMEHED